MVLRNLVDVKIEERKDGLRSGELVGGLILASSGVSSGSGQRWQSSDQSVRSMKDFWWQMLVSRKVIGSTPDVKKDMSAPRV